MRAIRIYSFDVKKAAKLSALPAIVHEYLENEGLTAGRFLYCLEAIDHEADARMNLERLEREGKTEQAEIMRSHPYYTKLLSERPLSPCERAVKDCPKLGAVKKLPSTIDVPMFNLLQVTNAVEDTGCTEEDIAPFFKKYERTYGAMNTSFFYYDVNFFGRSLPFFRDRSKLNPNLFILGDEPHLAEQIYGSGIMIGRSSLGETVLELSIDTLYGEELCDPEPYFKFMSELLPGAKYTTVLRVFLTDEEKAEIALYDKQAAPVIDACSGYLKEKLPSKERQTLSMPNYNIAPLLKKLAKRSGYSYSYRQQGFYSLTKRMPRGHYLDLFFTSGPSHCDTSMTIKLKGLGFERTLVSVMETPENQNELDAWLNHVFDVLGEFEKEYAPSLDALYKPTPDWFRDVD